MLTATKQQKLLLALKNYRKQYLHSSRVELDESGTRLMINSFLSDVLGYRQLEEIKTEYMIKGTYADYLVQVDSKRHFLVEVKALSFELSQKHLRQVVSYGANEGIDYALLTNGKRFEFYRILFEQPILSRLVFAVDLGEVSGLKEAANNLQHLHRDSVIKYSFNPIWNKCQAMDPYNIAGIICSPAILNSIKRIIKIKYKEKCDDGAVLTAVTRIITDKMDPALIKTFKTPREKSRKAKLVAPVSSVVHEGPPVSQ